MGLTADAFLSYCCLALAAMHADFMAFNSSGPALVLQTNVDTVLLGLSQLQELHLSGHVVVGAPASNSTGNDTTGNSTGSAAFDWPAAVAGCPQLRVLKLSGPGGIGPVLPPEWAGFSVLQSLVLIDMLWVSGEGEGTGAGPLPPPQSLTSCLLPWLQTHGCRWPATCLGQPDRAD
jgi:hypothetical protein